LCEFSQFLTISALSSIAPLKDAKQCLLKAHYFWHVIPMIPPDPFESLIMFFLPISLQMSCCLVQSTLCL
jgi:hypothetical protein